MLAVFQPRRPRHLLRHVTQQLLDHARDVAVVGVRLVRLQQQELGVVAGGYALVAEHASDLEHPVEAADQQPFEVQLERDAQVEVAVQGVVVGEERARRRPAGVVLQHRRHHLHEVALLEEPTHRRDRPRRGASHVPRPFARHQVQVALPVAGLHIGQAVPLLRHRAQRFRDHAPLPHRHRRLAAAGAEHRPARLDEIAAVDQRQQVEALAQHVALKVELDRAGTVAEIDERRLPHHPLRRHAAGDGDRLRLLDAGAFCLLQQRRRRRRFVAATHGGGIGIAPREQLLTLAQPLGQEFRFGRHR